MVQQRYVICVMNIIALTVSLGARFSFSIILTQMVVIPNLNQSPSQNHEIVCPVNDEMQETGHGNATDTIIHGNDDRFHWSQELQGIILSSFNWGYYVSLLPSGILIQKYGAKLLLLTGFFMSAIIIALTPMAVAYGEIYGLVIARAMTGVFQAPLTPCLAAFNIAWFPIEQRGRFSAVITTGIGLGGFFASYFTGTAIAYAGRWDVAFYVHGIITIMLCILTLLLCYDRPRNHPFISNQEKEFLEKQIDYLESNEVLSTPWIKILTSRPVIILAVARCFNSWVLNITQYDLPKYMNDVLHISIKKNALYSSLPKIANIFVILFAGFLSDWMFQKRGLSLTKVRRIFIAVSSMFPGMFLVAASYAECDEILVMICFMFAVGFYGFNIAGSDPNVLDLAPNYVGPITGLVTSVSILSSIASHYTLGVLTPHAYLSEWRSVLWLTFGFSTAKTIIFTLWGSAKIQPWNTPCKSSEKETNVE